MKNIFYPCYYSTISTIGRNLIKKYPINTSRVSDVDLLRLYEKANQNKSRTLNYRPVSNNTPRIAFV